MRWLRALVAPVLLLTAAAGTWPDLDHDPDIQAYAQAHAETMAAAEDIWHSDLTNVPGSWSRTGENVGMGPNLELLMEAFWDSPGHAANLRDDWDAYGLGQARGASGTLYVAHVFVKWLEPARSTTTTTTTTTPQTPPEAPSGDESVPRPTTTRPAPTPPQNGSEKPLRPNLGVEDPQPPPYCPTTDWKESCYA